MLISNWGFTFDNSIAINERKKRKIKRKQDDIFNLRQINLRPMEQPERDIQRELT